MLGKRIIPCLDVKDDRVVKGVNFANLADVNSPVELAKYYSANGAGKRSGVERSGGRRLLSFFEPCLAYCRGF